MIGTSVKRAVGHLLDGNIVGLPTETVYGLAGNAYEERVLAKIFAAKGRPYTDPLILHTASWKDAASFIEMKKVPPAAHLLAEAFFPGPLTMVLPKKACVPDMATAGLRTVGVRVPAHRLMRSVLGGVGFPLAAPSANPFGYISPTTAGHVVAQLGSRVPYILDGGPAKMGIESTIVGFVDGKPVVYRYGGIACEALRYVLGVDISLAASPKGTVCAPGMLPSHYAPSKPLLVGDVSALYQQRHGHVVGLLLFDKPMRLNNVVHQEVLSPRGDLVEAAHNLFAAMRRLDEASVDLILAAWVPDHGLGKAINDRLGRSSLQQGLLAI